MRGQSVIFSLLFVNNTRTHNGRKWRSCIIQEETASVFVGRFRCGLQRFFSGKKSPFQWIKQIWKLSLGGATISAPMRGKIFKMWENGCKVCARHIDRVEREKRVERKVLQEQQPLTTCIVDVHPYENILLTRYRVLQKTVRFVAVVPNAVGSATFCAHRNSIMPCNF